MTASRYRPRPCGRPRDGPPRAYRAAGAAEPDLDYRALSGEVIIPASAEFVFIPVVPSSNLPAEARLKVKLTLLADAAYTIAGPDRAKLTLAGGQ